MGQGNPHFPARMPRTKQITINPSGARRPFLDPGPCTLDRSWTCSLDLGYICKVSWGFLIYPGSILVLFCDGLKVMWSTLEPSWDMLRRSWDILGLCWEGLRVTWEHLGPIFGRPEAILELSYTGEHVNLIMLILHLNKI